LGNADLHRYQSRTVSPFTEVYWHYRSSKEDKSLFKQPWIDVQVTPSRSPNSYNLSFQASMQGKTQTYTLNDVLLRHKRGVKPKQRKGITATAMRQYQQAKEQLQQTAKILDSLRVIDRTLELEEMVHKTHLALLDSHQRLYQAIVCFHSQNAPFMSELEQSQSFRTWCRWVDADKALLRERYVTLRNSDRYQAIDAQMEAYYAAQRAQEESIRLMQQRSLAMQQQQLEIQQTLQQTARSLGIQQMGVYNCDQLKRVPNATELLAKYQDENGKPITAVSAYLINDQLNGAIVFNGTYGYSPYRLKYGKGSKNTLLLFDADGNGYKVNSAQFQNIVDHNRTTILQATSVKADTDKAALLTHR